MHIFLLHKINNKIKYNSNQGTYGGQTTKTMQLAHLRIHATLSGLFSLLGMYFLFFTRDAHLSLPLRPSWYINPPLLSYSPTQTESCPFCFSGSIYDIQRYYHISCAVIIILDIYLSPLPTNSRASRWKLYSLTVQTTDPRAPNPSLPLTHMWSSANYFLCLSLFNCNNGDHRHIYLYGCCERSVRKPTQSIIHTRWHIVYVLNKFYSSLSSLTVKCSIRGTVASRCLLNGWTK